MGRPTRVSFSFHTVPLRHSSEVLHTVLFANIYYTGVNKWLSAVLSSLRTDSSELGSVQYKNHFRLLVFHSANLSPFHKHSSSTHQKQIQLLEMADSGKYTLWINSTQFINYFISSFSIVLSCCPTSDTKASQCCRCVCEGCPSESCLCQSCECSSTQCQ